MIDESKKNKVEFGLAKKLALAFLALAFLLLGLTIGSYYYLSNRIFAQSYFQQLQSARSSFYRGTESGEGVAEVLADLKTETRGDFFAVVKKDRLEAAGFVGQKEAALDSDFVLAASTVDDNSSAAKLAECLSGRDIDVALAKQTELVIEDCQNFEQLGLFAFNNSQGENLGGIYVVKDINEGLKTSISVLGTELVAFSALLFFLLSLVFILLIKKTLVGPLMGLIARSEEVVLDQASLSFDVSAGDEVGVLARSLNAMVEGFRWKMVEAIGKKDKEITELEKISQSMTGREMKMIELKKEIEKLKHN